ncbi:hypothetical protein ACU8OR_33510 (plasmid) [Rhizobium leguminosarum]
MVDETLTPELFERAWSAGIAAVADERIDALQHLLAILASTVDRYRSTDGVLRQEMDQVLEIGLSKLQKSGEAAP